MSVYFLRAGESGPVKIGTAEDVPCRLRELQCGNHLTLIVIRAISGGNAEERWLHRHFRHLKISREWFSFSDEMLSIDVPALVPKQTSPIGHRIKCAREARGLSQVALADLVGCSQQTVNDYERGNSEPSLERLALMARATETAPGWLAFGESIAKQESAA